jgi:hypothetical protein
MNKVVNGADEAIRDIEDGMTLMIGGFGMLPVYQTMPVLMILALALCLTSGRLKRWYHPMLARTPNLNGNC